MTTRSAEPVPPRPYPLAKVMFVLAFIHLILIAGLVHRFPRPEVTDFEKSVMAAGLIGLEIVLTVEAWATFLVRNREVRPRGSALWWAVWITLVPPVRMGMPCPYTGLQWIPFLGWCERGKKLENRLERAFYKPMLVFALLIMPVLLLEYVQADDVRSSPTLALILHVSVSIIWVAFALEYLIRVSAARRPLKYTKERWLDLAIVLLPTLEFILTAWVDAAPLARLLRLSRAVAPEQLARMGQMYRLRGLLLKGWQAILVLRVVARLTGNTPEKQLAHLETQIAEAQAHLHDLQVQADELRARIAGNGMSNATAHPTPL